MVINNQLTSNNNQIKDRTVVFILGLISLILFWKVFFNPPISPDIISQYFPFLKFHKDFFLKHFSLPFWLPYANAGTPNLDQGVLFPLINILTIYIFPSELGPGIGYFFNIFLSGLFCFIFFNSLKINKSVSLLISIIFMMSGDMISYFYPGHVGKAFIIGLIPLSLFLINKGLEKQKWYYFFLAGICFGHMFVLHPQLFYYILIILTAYYFFYVYHIYKTENNKKIILYSLYGYAIIGLIAFFYAAPNLINQYFYQKSTSRGTLKSQTEMWEFATSWSEHPFELLTFFIPSLFGLYNETYLGWKPFVMTTDYMGVITIILVILGIILTWKKNKFTKFYFITLIIMILIQFWQIFPGFL